MSVRSILIPSALIVILVGCGKSPPTTDKTTSNATNTGAANTVTMADNPSADVGALLYPAAAPPVTPPPPPPGNDPIVIPCTVQYEDRQQISAEADGKRLLGADVLGRKRSAPPGLPTHSLAGTPIVAFLPPSLV
jgi:hypothetical protein